jgi:hypothetical protein
MKFILNALAWLLRGDRRPSFVACCTQVQVGMDRTWFHGIQGIFIV